MPDAGHPARYIANREAIDPAARATRREEDWIRGYIDSHPAVLTGPVATEKQQKAAAETQRQQDLAAAAALVESVKAALTDGAMRWRWR